MQYSGFSESKGMVVEAPGPTVTRSARAFVACSATGTLGRQLTPAVARPQVRHISGLDLLDNHQVNFFSSLITASVGAYAASVLF